MIEGVRIESDERGFVLLLEGDFVKAAEEYLRLPSATGIALRLPQDAALALRQAVREEIDPWWAEGEAVRGLPAEAVMSPERARALAEYEDEIGAYEPDDPKSPGYHDRVAGTADDARKAERENR